VALIFGKRGTYRVMKREQRGNYNRNSKWHKQKKEEKED